MDGSVARRDTQPIDTIIVGDGWEEYSENYESPIKSIMFVRRPVDQSIRSSRIEGGLGNNGSSRSACSCDRTTATEVDPCVELLSR
jgi:hypothetical protein